MGEVYSARDTRLDRTVAIKVLPPELTGNENLRLRFEREARAISAISHPNICALYDIGSEDGIDYLVMEHLEGETLSDRIARGPLPLSQVLELGRQIAEGLQQAHQAGITHRDLKPGNIMITRGGAKLLDFGLARFIEEAMPEVSEESATARPQQPLTAEGTIVGTFQYMAPEQLEGKPADLRSDVFSLGAILYEMVTGQRPFKGSSPASVMAAVLSAELPAVRTVQPAASRELERTIQTALEREPDKRWQSAGEVARQLRWAGESVESAAASPQQPVVSRGLLIAAVVLVALVAGLLALLVVRGLRPGNVERVGARLDLWLPPPLKLTRFFGATNFALSPDGRTLCFAGTDGEGRLALYLRPIDSYTISRLEGTEDGSGPFWSSSGEWIGFTARDKLWKTKVSGGAAPQELANLGDSIEASWQGHTILYAEGPGGRMGVFRISDNGGAPTAVTRPDPSGRKWRQAWPEFLPDGVHYFYLSYRKGSIDRDLIFASLKSSEKSVVLRNVSRPRIVGDQLYFVRDGQLLRQHFDLNSGALTGDPLAIASDISYFYPTGRADFDVAADTIVYRTDTSTGRLSLRSRLGAEQRLLDDKNVFYDLRVSGDGNRAAVSVVSRATGLADIWIYDLLRGVRERFTTEPWHEVTPVWSPDSTYIVYSEAAGGTLPHLVRRMLSGSSSQQVISPTSFQFAGSFSPDGQTLFYSEETANNRDDVFRLDMRTGKSERVLDSSFSEVEPNVSPDGRWLAYESDVTGQYEIYLLDLTATEQLRIRISSDGGSSPRWRHDGRELFLVGPGGKLMSAVPGARGWNDVVVKELFRLPDMKGFDVLPDGQSFLVMQGSAGPSDFLFHILLSGG